MVDMTHRYSLVDSSTNVFTDSVKFNSDDRLIILKEGQVIRCRLLRFSDVLSTRKTPWITKFVHSIYVKEDNGRFTSKFTACPSSQHFNIQDWQNRCLICNHSSNLFIKADKADGQRQLALKKAAKTLKRKFKMFIPAFIIENNMENEECPTIGKTKIIMLQNLDYLYRIQNFLERVESKNKGSLQNYFNNFDSMDAMDFILKVNEKNVFDISFEFKKTPSALISNFSDPDVQKSFIEENIIALKFDEDFYESSFDDDKHLEFFNMFAVPVLKRVGAFENTATPSQSETDPITPQIFQKESIVKKDEKTSEINSIIEKLEDTPTCPKVLDVPIVSDQKIQESAPILAPASTPPTVATTSNEIDEIYKMIEDIRGQN